MCVRVSELPRAAGRGGLGAPGQGTVDDPRDAKAKRITLVCDQLNRHGLGSLYKASTPGEAIRTANRLELVHTPKHGSWLNITECERSVLTRQRLGRRLAETSTIKPQATAWAADRNANQTGIDWRFTTEDARIKLKRLPEYGGVARY